MRKKMHKLVCATLLILMVSAAPLFADLIGDGFNPFYAPVETTNYYGSGDVDLDGAVTAVDMLMVAQMEEDTRADSYLADVDANGVIDDDDIDLVADAVVGGTLPGWWNSLTTTAARNDWIDKILALDNTNNHIYRDYYFVCGNFAAQLFTKGNYYRDELFYTAYSGGQTIYNIPLYEVSVTAVEYGHYINAVLTGDNPLNPEHWRFIEPQGDNTINPGTDLPLESTITIVNTDWRPNPSSGWVTYLVQFYIDDQGQCSYIDQSKHANFVTTRPTPPTVTPVNTIDRWNPVLLPTDTGMLIYEQIRNDMEPETDMHLASLPYTAQSSGTPLTLSSRFSRILDTKKGSDGTIHLLWKGEYDSYPAIWHGTLNTSTAVLSIDTNPVVSGIISVRMARLVITPAGAVSVIYFDEKTTLGFYWTEKSGSTWTTATNLTPSYTNQYFSFTPTACRDVSRYYFDVEAAANGDLNFVWLEPMDGNQTQLSHRKYSNSNWGTAAVIEDRTAAYNMRGMDLAVDSNGLLHLVYWLGNNGFDNEDIRGDILHRTYNGSTWSAYTTADDCGTAAFPRLAAGAAGKMYMVWEEIISSQVVPVISCYTSGSWQTEQALTVRTGAHAWYPMAQVLANGDVAFAWSSRGSDDILIETYVLESQQAGLIIDFENINTFSLSGGTKALSTTHTEGTYSLEVSGGNYQVLTSVNLDTATLQPVDDSIDVDFVIGTTQPNPYWIGTLELIAECPSASLYNCTLGQANLTPLQQGSFITLNYVLPANVKSVLNGSYTDFIFKWILNTNANSGPYLFDNMRYGQ